MASPTPSPTVAATIHPRPANAIALTRRAHAARCPHQARAAINTAAWNSKAEEDSNGFPNLAAAMLRNGQTIVIASAAPTSETVTATEFRNPCSLNRHFGRQGATELSLPHEAITIYSILPTPDGGAVIVGTIDGDNSRWLIGKLTRTGEPDPGFGHAGWVLPHQPGDEIDALAMTKSGTIVIGGDGTGNGDSFVRELSRRGRTIRSFGTHGRATMPEYHDGGIERLVVEPNGDILVLISGGLMGCYSEEAVTLDPSGRRIPGFSGRFAAGLRQADPTRRDECYFPIIVGDVVPSATGFRIIGVAERDCDYGCTEHPIEQPNVTKRFDTLDFRYDGSLVGYRSLNVAALKPIPEYSVVWTLPQADGDVLVADAPVLNVAVRHQQVSLLLYRVIGSSGVPDARYGRQGLQAVPAYPGTSNTDVDPFPVSNGRHNAAVVVADQGNAVVVVPIPAN